MYDVIDTKVLDIDTARGLRLWASTSYGKPKTMILSFHTITVPAQNALLKILEEPGPMSRFVLITSHKDGLLPTVHSRLIEHDVNEEAEVSKTVKLFLKTDPLSRMKLEEVQALLEAKDDSERKDRESVQAFLSQVLEQMILHKAEPSMLRDVADAVLHASNPSSSGKVLVEYIALRAPRL
jgi:DNA polymerase-3 subunit delta'